MEETSKSYKAQIIVAVIGVTGVLGAALIANWDKIFKSTSAIVHITDTTSHIGKPNESFTPSGNKGQLPGSDPPINKPVQSDQIIMPSGNKGQLPGSNPSIDKPVQSNQINMPFLPDESGSVTKYGEVLTGIDHPPKAGDWNNNVPTRGFLSFDISEVPTGILLDAAELDLTGSEANGNVFPAFGVLTIESVWFGTSLVSSAYSTASYSMLSATPNFPPLQLNVKNAVNQALTKGYTRFQVRFRFEVETNNNNVGETFWVPVHMVVPKLTLTYHKL